MGLSSISQLLSCTAWLSTMGHVAEPPLHLQSQHHTYMLVLLVLLYLCHELHGFWAFMCGSINAFLGSLDCLAFILCIGCYRRPRADFSGFHTLLPGWTVGGTMQSGHSAPHGIMGYNTVVYKYGRLTFD